MSNNKSYPAGFKPIYLSNNYQAIYKDYASDSLIITFSERCEPAPANFFATTFIEKNRFSCIAVRSLTNDWYLSADMSELVRTIVRTIQGSNFKKVILFGSSMGSFGCIRVANEINPDKIIVAGPIVSLCEDVEKRWISDYKENMASYLSICDSLLPLKCKCEVVAIYDPLCEDARHVNILQRFAEISHIKTHNTGHMALKYLKDSGVLSEIIKDVVCDDFDINSINRKLTSTNRENKTYLLNLFDKLSKKPRSQNIVLNYAMKRFPDEMDVRIAEANFLSSVKKTEMSGKIINDVVLKFGDRAFGVSLARAIAEFTRYGGDPLAICCAVSMFASERPRSRQAQLWYSRYLRYHGDYDRAFLAHEHFLNDGMFAAHAYIERGIIFENMKLLVASRDSFSKARELAPEFVRSQDCLARVEKKLMLMISTPTESDADARV